MTEEEAKAKWCPQARVVGILNDTYVPAGNRAATSINDADVEWNDNPESCRCIASACMAWRVTRDTVCESCGDVINNDARHGFCGLAGHP